MLSPRRRWVKCTARDEVFSSTSFAEWTKVSENVSTTFYVDFERIRKHGGYVYFLWLSDYLKPDK